MKNKKVSKLIAGIAALVFLLISFSTFVLASSGAPASVTNARSSVVRIAVMHKGSLLASGSGFAVGKGKDVYIVTNWHVTYFEELNEEDIAFRLYYAESTYMPATLLDTSPGRDLAILSPNKKIPGLAPLPIQTATVKVGTAGYALGFPVSADDIAGIFLTGKDAVTVTNGIVSNIRTSSVGDGSIPSVRLLQTNIAISGGNSGGPLLDADGNIIGINTLGVITDTNLFGCVHVQELIEYLEDSDIPYVTASDKVWGRVLWVAVPSIVVLVILLVVLLMLRRKKKAKKSLTPLTHAIALGSIPFRDERSACNAAKSLLREMFFSIESFLDGSFPLSVNHVYITRDNLLTFRFPKTKKAQQANGSRQAESSLVYFSGAVLYAAYTGTLPPDATARSAGAQLALGNDALSSVIRKAMELEGSKRFSSLLLMLDTLNKITPYVKTSSDSTPRM